MCNQCEKEGHISSNKIRNCTKLVVATIPNSCLQSKFLIQYFSNTYQFWFYRLKFQCAVVSNFISIYESSSRLFLCEPWKSTLYREPIMNKFLSRTNCWIKCKLWATKFRISERMTLCLIILQCMHQHE